MGEEALLPCSHTVAIPPTINSFAGGIMTYRDDFHVVICGSPTDDSLLEKCASLNGPDHQILGHLLSKRVGAAYVVVDNGTRLWVTGGFNGKVTLKTTEFLQLDNGSYGLMPGPSLPFRSLKYHCLEKVASNAAILIGGQDMNTEPTDFVWLMSLDSMEWFSIDSLITGRYEHACGVLKDMEVSNRTIVVAAGGETYFGAETKSVELLVFVNGHVFNSTWSYGSNMPRTISNTASGTTADQHSLFVIGDDSGHLLVSVYRLQCFDLQCSWKSMDHGFKDMSVRGLALILPTISPMAFINFSNANTDQDTSSASGKKTNYHPQV